MDYIKEIENMRKRILQEINIEFDILIEQMSGSAENTSEEPTPYEITYPLTAGGAVFKGRKPSGIIFEGEEPIRISTWRQLVDTVLSRCIRDDIYRKRLEGICGKVSGKKRLLLADSPTGMRSPLKVTDRMYMESHYDTETLIKILITRILMPIGYDYSKISVTVLSAA